MCGASKRNVSLAALGSVKRLLGSTGVPLSKPCASPQHQEHGRRNGEKQADDPHEWFWYMDPKCPCHCGISGQGRTGMDSRLVRQVANKPTDGTGHDYDNPTTRQGDNLNDGKLGERHAVPLVWRAA